jgi:glutamine amidotransferase
MQWLFEGSEEAPESPGLGVLAGQCHRLGARAGYGPPNERANGQPVKIPHVGWNELTLRGEAAIVRGIAPDAQVYFTHSYAAPVTGDTVAVTTHGETFASIVARDRVAGVQFHPEKSGEVGLEILRNFLRMVK